MQVKEGRDGSDEDADEVTGGEKRGSSDKKRKGDVSETSCDCLSECFSMGLAG